MVRLPRLSWAARMSWTTTGVGSAARAVAAGATTAARTRPRRARLGTTARDATPPSGVERLDALGVLVRDRTALELHRRGQLVAAGQPLVGQQVEAFDLLD